MKTIQSNSMLIVIGIFFSLLANQPVFANENCDEVCLELKMSQMIDLEYQLIGNGYDWVAFSGFSNQGLLGVGKNDKFGFVDMSGKIVIPLIYDEISFFDDKYGLAGVKRNNKWGFIDVSNRLIIDYQYDDISCLPEGCIGFENGLAIVKKNGKYGIIDNKNKVVVPFEYDYIDAYNSLDNDRIEVKKNGKTFFIDRKGNRVQ